MCVGLRKKAGQPFSSKLTLLNTSVVALLLFINRKAEQPSKNHHQNAPISHQIDVFYIQFSNNFYTIFKQSKNNFHTVI